MDNTQLLLRMKKVADSRTFKNILTTYDLQNKKVLDIGCSYGEFLTHFGKDSLGLSVNPLEVAWGEQNNLNIKLGNIEESFDTDETFDVIFANNLFEHMLAPHIFLIKIKKYLKPDGILILGVPCIPYLFPLTIFKKFNGYSSPAHVNFFVKHTLGLSVRYAGWNILSNRGFIFKNKYMDHLADFICPHFYVTAHVDTDFAYDEKRKIELSGYSQIINNK